jgi:lysozyme
LLRATRVKISTSLAAALSLLAAAPASAKVVCPGANSVYGIDVSEFQGNIDWAKVKAAGKEFAIIRVSDGTGHLDPDFAKNWSGAKAAGVIRGVYQFFEPSEDPVAQANLLLQHMGQIGEGDLPPMIDVEVTDGQSPATITARIHSWINTVQAATGRKPLIYTGGWFWNPDVQSGDFGSYPLVDSYYCGNCCPDIASPWTSWTMWQYSSTGAVSGIAGNVDLDRFDGTMGDLQMLAGGSPDWSASYVSQSWPLATSSLDLTVNQSLPGSITMKNDGKKSWTGNTRLGTTQMRDRSSVFVAPDWIGPNRPAGCMAGAAPGASCKFAFTWHAPSKPGDYHEFFGMVEEGVAWFSDQGQGGPPDNQIEAWIHVSEADYHGELASMSFPDANTGDVSLGVGSAVDGFVEVKNIGLATWKAGVTKLAPTPRDQASPVAGSDWLSPTRAATVAADVPPGAVGHFAFSLGGGAAGDYTQTFALVEEGVTWFADAPKGGGPADDAIAIHVVVSDSQSPMVDGGVRPPADGGAKPGADGGTSTTGADGGDGGVMGGCSTGGRSRSPVLLAVLTLLGLALRRRSR